VSIAFRFRHEPYALDERTATMLAEDLWRLGENQRIARAIARRIEDVLVGAVDAPIELEQAEAGVVFVWLDVALCAEGQDEARALWRALGAARERGHVD
jgi:hypothetical protein